MPRQAGDLAAARFQMGGMAHIVTEPGELIFPGPLRPETLTALHLVNDTYPRFPVPGTGTGDHVPLAVPQGSFVLNRRAAKVMRDGYQDGGTVVTNSPPPPITVTVNITVQATVHTDVDIRVLADQLSRHVGNQLTATLNKPRALGGVR